MKTAPRDGTIIRLHLRDGSEIVGYYSDRWWSWIDRNDPHSLVRGDISFSGWEPIDDVELRQIDQAMTRPTAVAEKTVATAIKRPAIVRARKPRPRR